MADALNTARINLPVDSQTDISAKLLKQSSMAGRTCVPYVNSWLPVRGPVARYLYSNRYFPLVLVLSGLSLAAAARMYGQVRTGARGGWRRRGKARERRPAAAERREGGQ